MDQDSIWVVTCGRNYRDNDGVVGVWDEHEAAMRQAMALTKTHYHVWVHKMSRNATYGGGPAGHNSFYWEKD